MQIIKFKLFFLIILFSVSFFRLSAFEKFIISANYFENDQISDTSKPYLNYSLKGKEDAKKYYKHLGQFSTCFLTSFLMPPAGFITTLAVSVSKPQIHHLGIPYEKKELLLNKEYMDSYIKAARKRKFLLSWAGFFTGTAFFSGGFIMTGYTPDYFFKK